MTKHHDRTVRVRLGICMIVFLFGFTALTVRAWQLQLISDQRVVRLEEKQLDRKFTLSPQRGSIFDAKGRELALSLKVPSIYADPSEVKNPKEAARKLSQILGVSRAEIFAKLKRNEKKFVWLSRRVEPSVEKKVEDLGIRGIGVTQEWTRLYPERELAAQVIGVVGAEGDGLEGLERFYNRFLKSQSKVVRAQKDAKGRTIFTGETPLDEPDRGADLYLTLDATIQHTAEKELFEAAAASGSKSAMGVVMNPSDGKILAMVSYPPANPNRIGRLNPQEWRNRPVEEVFEPGSTFKVFTLAAALDAGVITPSRMILCKKGSLVVGGKVIRNTHDADWLNPEGILKVSNNVGVARIGLELGRDRMARAVSAFGFGGKTGIDFPVEPRGLVMQPERWKSLELANISFGQGIGVTAVQLTAALSAIANGGYSVRPFIVERGELDGGEAIQFQRAYQQTQVIHPATVRLLQRWMESVTEKGGTGDLAAIPQYRTAGKTGTAQMVDPVTKKYSSRLVTSSFMGFAPVSDPRLAAIFIFREPRKADYGGTLAGPVFRKVISASLQYLGVPPDKSEDKKLTPAKAILAQNKPAMPRVLQDISGAPDFRGLTMREVLTRARELSLDVSVVGSGVAIRQEMKTGSGPQKEKSFKVYFASAPEGEGI